MPAQVKDGGRTEGGRREGGREGRRMERLITAGPPVPRPPPPTPLPYHTAAAATAAAAEKTCGNSRSSGVHSAWRAREAPPPPPPGPCGRWTTACAVGVAAAVDFHNTVKIGCYDDDTFGNPIICHLYRVIHQVVHFIFFTPN